MKHLFITVIAAVLLAGCTTNVALEKHDWKTVKQEEVDVRSYTLGGEPQMVPVGSTLIRRQKYLTSIMEHSGYVEASNDFVMSTFPVSSTTSK